MSPGSRAYVCVCVWEMHKELNFDDVGYDLCLLARRVKNEDRVGEVEVKKRESSTVFIVEFGRRVDILLRHVKGYTFKNGHWL